MDKLNLRYDIRQKMLYTGNQTWYGRIIEADERPYEFSLKTTDVNKAKEWLDEQNAIYLLYCNAIKRGVEPDVSPLTRRTFRTKSNKTNVALEEAINAFLDFKAINNADPKTIRVYGLRLNKMLDYAKERDIIRLKDFDLQVVEEYYGLFRNLSNQSRYCVRSVGKQFFEWALQRYSITSIVNPFLSLPKVKITHKESKVWNAKEIQAIIDNSPDVEWRAFFAVAAFTGARDSEIYNLLVDDYDEAAKTLRFHIGVKFGKQRSVHVSEQLAQYLKDYLDSVVDKSGNMFAHIPNTNAKRNAMLRKVAKAAGLVTNEAEIPNIKMHRFRHSVTTAMVAAGCDLRAVAQTLGHSNPATTLSVYTHTINADTLAAATDRLWASPTQA